MLQEIVPGKSLSAHSHASFPQRSPLKLLRSACLFENDLVKREISVSSVASSEELPYYKFPRVFKLLAVRLVKKCHPGFFDPLRAFLRFIREIRHFVFGLSVTSFRSNPGAGVRLFPHSPPPYPSVFDCRSLFG